MLFSASRIQLRQYQEVRFRASLLPAWRFALASLREELSSLPEFRKRESYYFWFGGFDFRALLPLQTEGGGGCN